MEKRTRLILTGLGLMVGAIGVGIFADSRFPFYISMPWGVYRGLLFGALVGEFMNTEYRVEKYRRLYDEMRGLRWEISMVGNPKRNRHRE